MKTERPKRVTFRRCHLTAAAVAGSLLLSLGCFDRGAREPAPSPGVSSGPRVAPTWTHRLDAQPAVSAFGMIATDAPLATEVGVSVLRSGGNAVDAAIATAFALAVVLPSAGNIGGGGFMVMQVGGQSYALDCRETAPAAATRNMFLDGKGNPTDRSVTGHLASGVPGSVAGLWAAHEKLGSRPWKELVEPAERLASEGFLVDADFAQLVASDKDRFARFPATAALFLPGGQPLKQGTRWKNPELAEVLRRIADKGPEGFYTGPTADLVVAEMRRGKGLITREDLRSYKAKWRQPITFTYRGHQVVSMPPPSSGGITLALIAQQLEGYDLKGAGWQSPATVHLEVEAMRRAFAIRNAVIGDPDFVTIPQEGLLAKDYAARLRASISKERATPSADVSREVGIAPEGRHTTHFSVTDRSGNAVAMTTTINSWHGSAVTVTGGGFLLNNEMDDFASKPGTPNQFGLVQGEANAIAPGKRMSSSMVPTIVLAPDRTPLLVIGASGGPYIITTVFQLLSNRVDYGLGVAASLAAPRFHHQHLPEEVFLEQDGFGPELVRGLEALHHQVKEFDMVNGGSIAAAIERRDGRWYGASDPRIHGLARGY